MIEVKHLPQRCIDCEAAADRWNNGTETEKIEIEKEFDFDCGNCDYAADRFIIAGNEKIALLAKSKRKLLERTAKNVFDLESFSK